MASATFFSYFISFRSIVPCFLDIQLIIVTLPGKLSRWLKPLGNRVFNLRVQKASFFNRIDLIFFSEVLFCYLFNHYHSKISFKIMARLVEMEIPSACFTSFRCLLILLLAPSSIFPHTIYPLLHLMLQPRYIVFLDLQSVRCRISYFFWPVMSVKKSVDTTCLQHLASTLPLYGVQHPLDTILF